MSTITNSGVNGGVYTGAIALTSTAFDALVAAQRLIPGSEYYISSIPARWIAKSSTTYDGVMFESNGTLYYGATVLSVVDEIQTAANLAAIVTLASALGLLPNKFITDLATDDLYWCTSSSTYVLVKRGQAEPGYIGRYTTVASLVAVSSPTKGDQAMLDLSGAPFPFFATYTGSVWRATAPLLWLGPVQVAGTGSASEQAAAGWITALPAGLLSLFRGLRVPMTVGRDVDTNAFTTLKLCIGSNSNGLSTSNTTILSTSGSFLAAGDTTTFRDPVYEYALTSTNIIRGRGATTGAKSTGHYAGATNTVTMPAEITLGGSDDWTDALYFSATATMGGTTSIPKISYDLLLTP